MPTAPVNPWIKVRNSKIHGKGVFAARDIPNGTRIAEYVGERLSHAEADARYADNPIEDNHTFLFIVDRRTVIDATKGGNDSRFINHSCDGNCESVIDNRRVFIETTRDIEKGEELGYDYEIGRDKDDPPNVDEIFACRCGSPKCRGTMLWPPKRPAPRRRRASKAKAKTKTRAKSKSKAKSKAGASTGAGAARGARRR
jgi:SET domain-containing protein